MIKKHVWDEFVELMLTDEAKTKAEKFKELAKRNELSHNLGMTGYAFHIEEWWREEREAAEAGQPSPLMSINERSRNYLYARRPKKRKEGSSSKYNKPNVEELEKKMFEIAVAERSRSFQPHRERDALTEAMENPEHRGRVYGVSSRQSWKDTFASDATLHHMRQRYKEGLIKQGRQEVIQVMVNNSVLDAFMSTVNRIVELRRKMF
jgi:hypothetical protein